MADLVPIPPIDLIDGVDFAQEWIFSSRDGVVDLSLWSGTLSLSYDVGGTVLLSSALTLGADGTIAAAIPYADFADVAPSPFLGGGPVGYYQIDLIAPDTTDNQIWQGVFTLSARL